MHGRDQSQRAATAVRTHWADTTMASSGSDELWRPVKDWRDASIQEEQHARQISQPVDELLDVDDVLVEPGPFLIAGFWRRFLALAIDVLILSVPTFVLSIVFRETAFKLGPLGRPIGFAFLFMYWSLLNSRICRGQSIGKRVVRAAVVDVNGEYLSLHRSLLRSLILVLIGLLNGWALPALQNPVVAILAVTIVMGGGPAVVYGLVFNRTTGQGIHDWIAKSYVVKAPPHPGGAVPQMRFLHKILMCSLVGFGLFLGGVGFFVQWNMPTFGILEAGEWEEIQELQMILLEDDDFFSVGVLRLNRRQLGSPNVMRDLNIDVWVKASCADDPGHCHQLVMRIAQTAFDNFDGIENLTGMKVTVINRFDLGLASGSRNQGAIFTIEDWRRELDQPD